MVNIGDIEPSGECNLIEGQKYSFIIEEDLQVISGELVGINGGKARIRFDGCVNIVSIWLDSIKAFRLANI